MHAKKSNLKEIGRLGSQEVYDRVRKNKSVRWTAEGLILQAMPREYKNDVKTPGYGLCVSVSKKIAKRAHDRNRIKRRLKAAAQAILPVGARADMNYMVTGRQTTLTRDFDLLSKDLLWCLKKLELLKSHVDDEP